MKQVVDLLGIILPALIIVLCLVRLFFPSSKGINGGVIFLAICLLVCGLLNQFVFKSKKSTKKEEPKLERVAVGKYSTPFYTAVQELMEDYYDLGESFADSDAKEVKEDAQELVNKIQQIPANDLRADSLIYEVVQPALATMLSSAQQITTTGDLQQGRKLYNTLSHDIFLFISAIRYDQAVFNWYECETALGEDGVGNWFAKDANSKSPYAIKDCQELKTTLDYAAKAEAKK